MSPMTGKATFVMQSLFQFITKYVPSADFRLVDEIVMSYVISILEQTSPDCMNVNEFAEMMTTFVPDFNKIRLDLINAWVLEMESELSRRNKAAGENVIDEEAKTDKITLTMQNLAEALPTAGHKNARSHSNSESSSGDSAEGGRRSLIEEDELSAQCSMLQEMFPNSCAMEIKHCVTIAQGEMERAAATLMHRRENGQALTPGMTCSTRQQVCGDAEVKNRIISRYSYVDKNSDMKEHKPLAPKFEPKKLVRYRDNKIVSLKGERYTEVPKSGADEEHLKKPKKQHCP